MLNSVFANCAAVDKVEVDDNDSDVDVEARTRSLDSEVIMNDSVNTWEIPLVVLFRVSEIYPTIHSFPY